MNIITRNAAALSYLGSTICDLFCGQDNPSVVTAAAKKALKAPLEAVRRQIFEAVVIGEKPEDSIAEIRREIFGIVVLEEKPGTFLSPPIMEKSEITE